MLVILASNALGWQCLTLACHKRQIKTSVLKLPTFNQRKGKRLFLVGISSKIFKKMGSSSKKYKEKECRKRRHHSPGYSEEHEGPSKEKRHRHKRHHHHRDRKREKAPARVDYESDGEYLVI